MRGVKATTFDAKSKVPSSNLKVYESMIGKSNLVFISRLTVLSNLLKEPNNRPQAELPMCARSPVRGSISVPSPVISQGCSSETLSRPKKCSAGLLAKRRCQTSPERVSPVHPCRVPDGWREGMRDESFRILNIVWSSESNNRLRLIRFPCD